MICNKNRFQFRLIHVNIRGVQSNKNNLEHYLEEYKHPEIVTLNETMTNKNIKIKGYYCAARREPTGISGKHGSMILVKDTVRDVIELDFLKTQFQEEVIGIEIKGNDSRPGLNIVTLYNPPGNKVNPGIFHKGNYNNGNGTVIVGDLNCKHLIWGSNSTDSLGTDLAETLDDQDWIILNDGAKTRTDPRTGIEEVLDIAVCTQNILDLMPEFFVGECVGSDHFPLHISLATGSHDNDNPVYTRKVSQLNVARFKEIIDQRISSTPDAFETARDLDRIAELLPEIVRTAFEEACPETRVKKGRKPITPAILELIKRKRKLRREKNSAAANGSPSEAQRIQREMNLLGNRIKKEQKMEQRFRHERACKRLASENNPKKFFQSVRSLTCTDEGVTVKTKRIKDELGNIASTAQERIDLFASRLERVHQTPEYVGFDDGWKISVERYIRSYDKCFTINPIAKYLEPEHGDTSPLVAPPTVEEVADHLRNCKTNSASGHDGVGYGLLKKVPPSYTRFITKFFGACLRIGYFPKAWKHAKIIMIPKPNKEQSEAKNYRPISLLSCLGKLFERLLAGRLSNHLEQNGLFNKNQSGYRQGKMTSDHLLRMVEEGHDGFRSKEVTASLFLDAEAAFDKCWHDGLRYKLKETLGLPDRLVRVISSFLTDRTLQVVENGLMSRVVKLGAGTPQGSCLSPLIYIISVNDLPTGDKQGVSQFQFADDIAVCGSGKNELLAVAKVQKAVDAIEGWCRKWRVLLNGSKSNLVIITRKTSKLDENVGILLFNDVVRPISKAKFLGVEIDPSLRFKEHIQDLAQKSEKRLNILKILARGGTDPKILLRLYKTYIRSIFEYGCVAFLHVPDSSLEILQKTQNQAIRIALRLPKYVSIKLLHKSACLPTVKERLTQLGSRLLVKMRRNNPLISDLALKKETENISLAMQHGFDYNNRPHRSPLDILLPVKRPFLDSS